MAYKVTNSMIDYVEIEVMFLADLFENRPALIQVFLQKRLGCVGCSLKSFCRLTDTATAYSLDYENFIGEVKAVVQSPSNQDSKISRNGKEPNSIKNE